MALATDAAATSGGTMAGIALTGSASGIGAATRRRLERAGHDVIGVDSSFLIGTVLFVDGGTDAMVRPDTF